MSDKRKETSILAQQAGKGDARAFAELVEIMTPTCYRIAVRILSNKSEAQDVLQEVFTRVWNQLPTLRKYTAATGWIYQICRNASLDKKRYLGRRNHQGLDKAMPIDQEPGPAELMEQAQRKRALVRALGTLKEKHRIVVMMRDVDDMSCEEIAETLGIAVGTVDSRLHRARKRLAVALGREALREEGNLRRFEGDKHEL